MAEMLLEHMHGDIEKMKQHIAVIMHILSEEGRLTAWAEHELAKARTEPASTYTDLDAI